MHQRTLAVRHEYIALVRFRRAAEIGQQANAAEDVAFLLGFDDLAGEDAHFETAVLQEHLHGDGRVAVLEVVIGAEAVLDFPHGEGILLHAGGLAVLLDVFLVFQVDVVDDEGGHHLGLEHAACPVIRALRRESIPALAGCRLHAEVGILRPEIQRHLAILGDQFKLVAGFLAAGDFLSHRQSLNIFNLRQAGRESADQPHIEQQHRNGRTDAKAQEAVHPSQDLLHARLTSSAAVPCRSSGQKASPAAEGRRTAPAEPRWNRSSVPPTVPRRTSPSSACNHEWSSWPP